MLTFPQWEGSNLAASQASQAGVHLPSGEGSNLAASQVSQTGSQAQAGAHLPLWKGNNLEQPLKPLRQAVKLRQVLTFPQWEGSNLATSQASQAGSQAQAGAHLPQGKGSNLVASQASQAGSQAQAGTHLPSGEGSN